MNPYAIFGISAGVLILLAVLIVRGYGRARERKGEAKVEAEVLEVDRGKQKKVLEHLQRDARSRSKLSRAWRKRMRE